MDELTVTDAVFEFLGEGEAGAVRIFASGGGFHLRGLQPAAKVGDVPVQDIVSYPGGAGFSGTLESEPADGARLRVGWNPEELVDTDVVYHADGGGNNV
jgi:hypothetical protein